MITDVIADRAASVSAYVGLISAVQTLEQTHGKGKLYCFNKYKHVFCSLFQATSPHLLTHIHFCV